MMTPDMNYADPMAMQQAPIVDPEAALLEALLQRQAQGMAQGWSGPNIMPQGPQPQGNYNIGQTAGYAGPLRQSDVPSPVAIPLMRPDVAMKQDLMSQLTQMPGEMGQLARLNMAAPDLAKVLAQGSVQDRNQSRQDQRQMNSLDAMQQRQQAAQAHALEMQRRQIEAQQQAAVARAQLQQINPKKYEKAQEEMANFINSGVVSPEELQKKANSLGFSYGGHAQTFWSQFGGGISPTDVQLDPIQSQNAQRSLLPGPVQQQIAQPGAAPAEQRITVEKGGKKFSLPASQLQEAIKQGYKQVK